MDIVSLNPIARESIYTMMKHNDFFERPREYIREILDNEREMLKTAALNEIQEWVTSDPRDAALWILEHTDKGTENLLNWANAYHYDDEGVEMLIGFWPWKDDPIPAAELGIPEVEDV